MRFERFRLFRQHGWSFSCHKSDETKGVDFSAVFEVFARHPIHSGGCRFLLNGPKAGGGSAANLVHDQVTDFNASTVSAKKPASTNGTCA